MKPEEALSYYQLEGAVKAIAPFGLGHINDSFKVITQSGDYLLQQINSSIFQYPDALEDNLKLVVKKAPELFAEFIRTEQGAFHLVHDQSVWRLQKFVEESYSPDIITKKTVAYQLGLGFGFFTSRLSDMDADETQEAIPHFHDLGLRIKHFEEIVEGNTFQRNQKVPILIEKATSYTWIWDKFQNLVAKGLPRRVCHNDTKSTNILLSSKNDQFLKVIDLDTVGPGFVMFDYGDMIRSIATHASEDDRNALDYPLRPNLIEACLKGYLEACGNLLTPSELESLAFGALYMTYFTGIRMLTDFLEGDIYYKIDEPDDNLVRARNQFYELDLLNEYFENDEK